MASLQPEGWPPWSRGPRSGRRILAGVLLIALPLPLAVLFLILGLSTLVWVYLSIAMAVAAIPSFAFGVVLIVRRNAVPANYAFNAPPGWPSPPAHWSPPPGWQPDPAWPVAADDWVWWQPVP